MPTWFWLYFFYSEERESLRIPEICLTDLDFADDIVLSDEIRQARQFLSNVDIDCGKVELLLNAKKTKAKYFNIEKEEMKTVDGTKIKQVVVEETGEQDSNTWEAGYVLRKETNVCKELAYQSLNKKKNLWKSD